MSDATLVELTERLKRMQSQLDLLQTESDVAQVLYRYGRALDRLDEVLLRSVFHKDADIDMGKIYQGGVDGFVEVALGFMGAMDGTQHNVGSMLIDVKNDRANVESYVYAHHRMSENGNEAELIVGARYLDQLIRENGQWTIIKRTEVLDFGRMSPLSDSWFTDNAELDKGRRDKNDKSYTFLQD